MSHFNSIYRKTSRNRVAITMHTSNAANVHPVIAALAKWLPAFEALELDLHRFLVLLIL